MIEYCWRSLRIVCSIGFGILVAALPTTVAAQDKYPSRFVRILTTTGTGTSPDIVMRIVAARLSEKWGQQVIVENNSTGAGLVAAQQAAAAAPDGHTLLLASASAFTVLPIRYESALTVIGKDLKPIAFMGDLPMSIAVSRKLGVTTIGELVAMSRATPEKILYAANATGTLPHMTGEYFKSRTGASLTFVPYKGTADAMTGLLSGQVHMIVENYVTLEGMIKSGDLLVLGFASQNRLPNFPDVPTIGETVPGFLAGGWAALTAPAGVSDAIVDKINSDVREIFDTPDVKQRMIGLGNYPINMTTAELAQFIKKEQAQWGPIVRQILAPSPPANPATKAN
jgi:tripartite-type tricarboxylate transporter receptor subunit TctC